MALQLQEAQGVRLAIEGCGHGTLHAIYASVAEACKRKGWPDVDVLIICGDFQAVRNAYDLNCVSMPAKYREMGDFHEYYSGVRTAPYLTLFIGGNHEASNHLFELYYGGWVAPNIYYMGAANVLNLGPLRILGLSGIWKGYSYRKPHYERLPYTEGDIKTIYDVRELDVKKLLQIRTPIDIGLSHDWPNGIEWKGDWEQLFRFKQHLEPDAKDGRLGSTAAMQVLDWLRPRFWFSAHLHCKYSAVVGHEAPSQPSQSWQGKAPNHLPPQSSKSSRGNPATAYSNTAALANQDEIDLGSDIDEFASARNTRESSESGEDTSELRLEEAKAELPDSFRRPADPTPKRSASITNTTTQFLALDKCLPGRHFLQLMQLPGQPPTVLQRPLQLRYDREWLAITKTFALDDPLVLGDPDAAPDPEVLRNLSTQEDCIEYIDKRWLWVEEYISEADLVVPLNFERTAPVYDGGDWNAAEYSKVKEYSNPQTARFCKLLKIPNAFEMSEEMAESRMIAGPRKEVPWHQEGGNQGEHRGGHRGGRGGRRGGVHEGGNRGGHRGGGYRGGNRRRGGFTRGDGPSRGGGLPWSRGGRSRG